MWTYRYGAAALAVAIALAGCSAATTTTKPDPDPEPAAPSLLGTWEITLDPDDYGEARHRVLTFRPNRYVVVVTERDAFGAIIGTGNVSGGWEQSDTHLTKIYLDDEADNAAVSVPKRYTLTADTLTVQEWVNSAADARDITYTRVTDPAILTTPAGSRWTLENNDAGNMQSWTLAFTDAGWSYTYRGQYGRFRDGRRDVDRGCRGGRNAGRSRLGQQSERAMVDRASAALRLCAERSTGCGQRVALVPGARCNG